MSKRKERNKLQMLGRFAYHHRKVTLQATEDETKYYLKVWRGSSHHIAIKNPKPDDVFEYDDLRIARSEFENEVKHAVSATSFTDVSIFMQQQATARI